MPSFLPRTPPSLRLLDTVIETPRLRLVPTVDTDAEDIFHTFVPEVTPYMFPEPAARLEDTLEFIRQSRRKAEAGANLKLTISEKTTGEFLGCCGLYGYESVKTLELGVWIKQQARGYGYGKEAVLALVNWASETLEVSSFVYSVDRRDAASRRVLEALGGTVERVTTRTGPVGIPLELVTYRIASSDIRTVLE